MKETPLSEYQSFLVSVITLACFQAAITFDSCSCERPSPARSSPKLDVITASVSSRQKNFLRSVTSSKRRALMHRLSNASSRSSGAEDNHEAQRAEEDGEQKCA